MCSLCVTWRKVLTELTHAGHGHGGLSGKTHWEMGEERIRTFGALSPALFRGGLPTDGGRLLPVLGEKLSRELFES